MANQLVQAERSVENAPDDRARRIQQANVEILKRRLAAFGELERSVKLVEGQLQSIENFFGLVNDQVVTLPTPERVSALDFEQLSDSIAMTKQMLEDTSDVMGTLDEHNRQAGNYDLLVKFYVEDQTDIGHFVNERVQTIPGIQDTHTIITFKAF